MLQNREDLKNIRAVYKKSLQAQEQKLLVCAGTGCVAGGSLEIYAEFDRLITAGGLHCGVSLEKEPHEGSIGLKRSGCHGFCEMGPLVRIEPQGWLYLKVKPEDCAEIIETSIRNGKLVERLSYKMDEKHARVYPREFRDHCLE